ncbi:MAG TPA: GIY-YIG nuclease family protein [Terriglobales bacterium]|jgi:predicted GIY-YIG superfamily endonuclease|nr:GIY-YIG nuclease family protein [Terriglobales bacterium]
MAKTWARSESLVEAHIRDVSIGAILKHIKSFREFLGRKRSGIYVLRKDRKVYYVGLASSLRSRLPDHLDDHHRGEWNQFDLYVLRKNKVKYLRELETLLIRVAKPTANQREPNFLRHNNLTKKFKQALLKETSGLFLGR